MKSTKKIIEVAPPLEAITKGLSTRKVHPLRRKLEQTKMTDTNFPLRDTASKSYQLIHSWGA